MINVCRMTKKGDFPKVCQDFIQEEGIPSVLRRDQAKNEQSKEVMEICWEFLEICWEFLIKDEHLEADNQQQNPVEVHAIRWLKQHCNVIMDCAYCPDEGWLDTLRHLANIHNLLAKESLGWINPFTKRHGFTKDISAYLHCRHRQRVHHLDVGAKFPSSKERSGCWVGAADNVGDALTCKICDAIANGLTHKSVARPADDPSMPNHWATFLEAVERGKALERMAATLNAPDDDEGDDDGHEPTEVWENTVAVTAHCLFACR